MRKFFDILLLLIPALAVAQPKLQSKKYPSLLWEISGHGLKQPSYLFGTMHVSSKLAFHLADSFYLAIRHSDIVALETNPDSWQEELSKLSTGPGRPLSRTKTRVLSASIPDDYLTMNTLRFFQYEKKIERALQSVPAAINNLLYRSYGNESSDFEEDTYLDMYIYQCGKKWGKQVTGVENYGESVKLVKEAYRDASRDRNRKERSPEAEEGFSYSRLQDAYRTGNLDWLDSIYRYNSLSPAFDEKFIYRRNEIQANSIDSILRSGKKLFAGIGASHLPGDRGVIELLREMGYRLRPVKMGARDSRFKTSLDKIRVSPVFTIYLSDDGLFRVDLPGKFYRFGDDGSLDQRQFADLANGSYYMVTRIMTNAWLWGQNTGNVLTVVDSLLYENIPGKILVKKRIQRNGFEGIEVINKTRRGDLQRYNIYVTPFEVILFKLGGTGEYLGSGPEADRFFNSVSFKPYVSTSTQATASWVRFSPSYGGFVISMPHVPYMGNDGSWIFDSRDHAGETHFRLVRSDIHNYHFTGNDSLDLELMAESFGSSDFIDTLVSKKGGVYLGYPSLLCYFRDKSGGIFLVRFILRGPHYYTLATHARKENPSMHRFLDSFEFIPYRYGNPVNRTDSLLYYTVNSHFFPDVANELDGLPPFFNPNAKDPEGELSEKEQLESGILRSRVIRNDSTGERLYVSFIHKNRYEDPAENHWARQEAGKFLPPDSCARFRKVNQYKLPGDLSVVESVLSDSGSSRCIYSKAFMKGRSGYLLLEQSDTLSGPGEFAGAFFKSFSPLDFLPDDDTVSRKQDLFFADFMSPDSILHKRAVRSISVLRPEESDLTNLMQTIASLSWRDADYLNTKKALISRLSLVKSKQASDCLKSLYYAAGDTILLQYEILETLLRQKTLDSYLAFRDIMVNEPPLLFEYPGSVLYDFDSFTEEGSAQSGTMHSADNGFFLDELFDTLELSHSILPDLLPLLSLTEYKITVMQLLAAMIDRGLLAARDYAGYFPGFYVEARQEFRKQSVAEKQKAIEMAEWDKDIKKAGSAIRYKEEDRDNGNDKLQLLAELILPYWGQNAKVSALFNQILSSADDRIKYNTMILLLRNGRSVPNTLIEYFAANLEFSYEFYKDLKDISQLNLFPAKHINRIALCKSRLLFTRRYHDPDSLSFVGKLPAGAANRDGWIYFYKYKEKKDDPLWKFALVGWLSGKDEAFEIWGQVNPAPETCMKGEGDKQGPGFAIFTNTRINPDEPFEPQMRMQWKKLMVGFSKSGKNFYDRRQAIGYEPEFLSEFGNE